MGAGGGAVDEGGKTETVVCVMWVLYGYRKKKEERSERERERGEKSEATPAKCSQTRHDPARAGRKSSNRTYQTALIHRRMDRAYNGGTDFRGSRNEHGRAVESRVHAQLNR